MSNMLLSLDSTCHNIFLGVSSMIDDSHAFHWRLSPWILSKITFEKTLSEEKNVGCDVNYPTERETCQWRACLKLNVKQFTKYDKYDKY